MKELYVYHKLGLGDHIICNGLIRQLALQHDQVYVFCKNKNYKQVLRMFIDNPKITPVIRRNTEPKGCLVLRPKKNSKHSFDALMYEMAGIDFKHKWDSFHIERDLSSEAKLMEAYYINGDTFAFLHEDKKRGYNINRAKPRVRTVRPDIRYGLFDYIGILEKASEIHCIDSSFLNFIECSGINQDNLFFHKYVRIKENTEYGTPALKRDWRVIV